MKQVRDSKVFMERKILKNNISRLEFIFNKTIPKIFAKFET